MTDLVIYQKWEDMAVYMLKSVVTQLPKSERYAMGANPKAYGGHRCAYCRAVAIRHVGMRKKEVEEADRPWTR